MVRAEAAQTLMLPPPPDGSAPKTERELPADALSQDAPDLPHSLLPSAIAKICEAFAANLYPFPLFPPSPPRPPLA